MPSTDQSVPTCPIEATAVSWLLAMSKTSNAPLLLSRISMSLVLVPLTEPNPATVHSSPTCPIAAADVSWLWLMSNISNAPVFSLHQHVGFIGVPREIAKARN